MSKFDIVIIGAGISGLSLAHYAAGAGLKTLVLEKTERVGGAVHTHRFEVGAPRFWIELGAHTCYNSYAKLLGIIEDLDMIDQLMRREKVPFRILVEDHLRSIPSQLNIFELLMSAPRLFFLKKRGQSVKSYYSQIVGKGNFDKVFTHLFSAVPSQGANDFPADILFKRRQRRKDVLKSFTLPNGLQSVIDAIAAAPEINTATGSEVVQIEGRAQSFEIKTANGELYAADYVALATSPIAGTRLLRSIYPALADELAQVRVATVETVGVALAKEVLAVENVAGIVPTGDSFYSIVSRDTVPHDDYRGFTFHFKGDRLDFDAKLKRVAQVLRISSDQLELVKTKQNIVPSFRVGHEECVTKIDSLLAGKRILLTGNYLRGMSIEDCVLRSASEFNRLQKQTDSIAG
jgi:protoporphyrinogen oxidase